MDFKKLAAKLVKLNSRHEVSPNQLTFANLETRVKRANDLYREIVIYHSKNNKVYETKNMQIIGYEDKILIEKRDLLWDEDKRPQNHADLIYKVWFDFNGKVLEIEDVVLYDNYTKTATVDKKYVIRRSKQVNQLIAKIQLNWDGIMAYVNDMKNLIFPKKSIIPLYQDLEININGELYQKTWIDSETRTLDLDTDIKRVVALDEIDELKYNMTLKAFIDAIFNPSNAYNAEIHYPIKKRLFYSF